MGEARGKAGLQRGHLGGIHMGEGDAVVCPCLPAGQRGAKLTFALVDLQVAVLAQHGRRAGGGQERLKLCPGQIHQRGLRQR
jgi:hypothetical protein